MARFNDIDLENWRECDVNTDSLWLIQERAITGKHKNIYHGNFIPQIPDQLIRRYTKKDEVVSKPIAASGTTLCSFEAALAVFPRFAANSHGL
jgi:DNA modification methylase